MNHATLILLFFFVLVFARLCVLDAVSYRVSGFFIVRKWEYNLFAR